MMEMEPFLKEFGKTLKQTRKTMGLSQVTAAQNMRIDYRHYQNIEGGKINLRLDTLMKLVKFYSLDKVSRPFNLDACMDLLSGFKDTNAHDNWGALFHHFVEGGHAGFVTINCRTKTIDQINEKLFKTLGYRGSQDLIGKPIQNLLVNESSGQFDDLILHHVSDQVSKPFIVTFRTQPPAFPIPMMAVVKPKKDANGADEQLHCIFFDRKTLDEEGHRLKEILNGYQQFMELYPQLKAV
jgi:transcriptional regulator with XRE-family HTH domain